MSTERLKGSPRTIVAIPDIRVCHPSQMYVADLQILRESDGLSITWQIDQDQSMSSDTIRIGPNRQITISSWVEDNYGSRTSSPAFDKERIVRVLTRIENDLCSRVEEDRGLESPQEERARKIINRLKRILEKSALPTANVW